MDQCFEFDPHCDRGDEANLPETIKNQTSKRKRKRKDSPMQGNRRSEVWDHYDWTNHEKGVLYAVCKYCKESKYKAESRLGTSTAKRHTHNCSKYKLFVADNPCVVSDFDQKVFCRLFAEAIMCHCYPLRIVEHEKLRKIHKYLNEKVRSVSRNTILKYCTVEHNKLKKLLCDSLALTSARVCFTCDLWSACTSRGFLTLIAHYVDNDWKLRSKILNFQYFPLPHNGTDIYSFVLGLLKDWNLGGKAFTMTVDNASSMDVMATNLKSDLHSSSPLPFGGKYFHVRCCAHILNLIVQSGMKVVDNCVIKLRAGVKYVDSSPSRLNDFELCNLDTKSAFKGKLRLDMPIRWNSTYLMMKRALDARPVLDLLGTRDSKFRPYALNCAEWEIIWFVCQFLEPFYNMTVLFSGSDYPTANLYFLNIVAMENMLVEGHKHHILSIRAMAGEMLVKFGKYWTDYSLILSIAIVLDPRFKLKFVKTMYNNLYSEGAEEKVEKVYHAFVDLYKFYSSSISAPTNLASASNFHSTFSQQFSMSNMFEQFDAENVADGNQQSAIDSYLNSPPLPRLENVEFDILSYWKSHSSLFPVLAAMARDVLAVPITSVSSESSFSLGGRILNKYRSSLVPKNVEVLVTTQNWLFGYVGEEFMDEDYDVVEEKVPDDIDFDSLPT